MIDGKTETASGIVARGRELIIRLKKPVGDSARSQLTRVCVVPESTPIDPEGVKAPAPSAGPYYFAEFVLGRPGRARAESLLPRLPTAST